MQEFYDSETAMIVFEIYLTINCIVSVILTVTLALLTTKLNRAANQYFS